MKPHIFPVIPVKLFVCLTLATISGTATTFSNPLPEINIILNTVAVNPLAPTFETVGQAPPGQAISVEPEAYSAASFATFSQWLSAFFPDSGFGPGDDPNGHGIPLVVRYVFNLDPHQPEIAGSQHIFLQTDSGNQFLTLQYRRREEMDVTVVVEVSADLEAWLQLDGSDIVEVVPDGEMENVTVRDPVPVETGSRRFMRLEFLTPPPLEPEETPTGVEVERMSRLRARINWDDSGAETYSIERRPSGGTWAEVGNVGSSSFIDAGPRTRGETYSYRIVAQTPGMADSPPSLTVETTVPAIMLTMVGDSNLQRGADDNDKVVVKSYVGNGNKPAIDPDDYPDHPSLISGRVMLLRPDIEAVNHGIDGTETGTGLGNTDRLNVLTVKDGVTRFEGEMLGKNFPWREEGIDRVNAFAPLDSDYGYYSFGVNDIHEGTSPNQIRDNIAEAIDLWEAAGLSAGKLMITTISPRPAGQNQGNVPTANSRIRSLVAARGALLIDTSALVSNNDGLSWKGSQYHTDGIHFSDLTCDLIANEIVSKIPE